MTVDCAGTMWKHDRAPHGDRKAHVRDGRELIMKVLAQRFLRKVLSTGVLGTRVLGTGILGTRVFDTRVLAPKSFHDVLAHNVLREGLARKLGAKAWRESA